jgi:hypothetical protein
MTGCEEFGMLSYELVKDLEIMGKTVCTFLLCSGCAKATASEILYTIVPSSG